MKAIRVLAALLLAAAALSPFAVQADGKKKHNVVIHVTDNVEWKWNQALNNAGNLKKNLGKDNVQVEIVVNGPGLHMMKFDSAVGNRMEAAIKSGIDLMACGATMKAMKVDKKDLYPGVKVVPGGVVEIMQKQEQGWTYIKI